MAKFWLINCILVLTLLCGCNTVPVAEDVDQRQAHEIVAALNNNGISAMAERGTGSRAKYSVEVKRDSYSQAVAIMTELGLPNDPAVPFSDLVTQRGLVPNSREVEALRLDHALGTEMQEALVRNPAIASASVIVRQHFLEEGNEPKVSAVVQTKPAQKVEVTDVTGLIAHSVPGIKPENIFVSLHEMPASGLISKVEGAMNQKGRVVQVPLVPFLFAWSVPDGQYNTLVIAILALILVMSGVGVLIGYWYAYHQVSKTFIDERLPEVVARPSLGTRDPNDLTEV